MSKVDDLNPFTLRSFVYEHLVHTPKFLGQDDTELKRVVVVEPLRLAVVCYDTDGVHRSRTRNLAVYSLDTETVNVVYKNRDEMEFFCTDTRLYFCCLGRSQHLIEYDLVTNTRVGNVDLKYPVRKIVAMSHNEFTQQTAMVLSDEGVEYLVLYDSDFNALQESELSSVVKTIFLLDNYVLMKVCAGTSNAMDFEDVNGIKSVVSFRVYSIRGDVFYNAPDNESSRYFPVFQSRGDSYVFVCEGLCIFDLVEHEARLNVDTDSFYSPLTMYCGVTRLDNEDEFPFFTVHEDKIVSMQHIRDQLTISFIDTVSKTMDQAIIDETTVSLLNPILFRGFASVVKSRDVVLL
jgi:hypothetical protein